MLHCHRIMSAEESAPVEGWDIGEVFDFRIPSFPVLTVQLRPVTIKLTDEDGEDKVVTAFIASLAVVA